MVVTSKDGEVEVSAGREDLVLAKEIVGEVVDRIRASLGGGVDNIVDENDSDTDILLTFNSEARHDAIDAVAIMIATEKALAEHIEHVQFRRC